VRDVTRLLAIAALALVVVAAAAAATSSSFAEVDVSNAPGSQAEVAVAADPARPGMLFAAANSVDLSSIKALGNLMRTYSSTDGGATWTAGPGPTPAPYGGKKRCNGGDPAPAIDAAGHQVVAFLATACFTLESLFRTGPGEFDVARLEVATRPDAATPWRVAQVFPVRSARFDDKPAIAIDRSTTSPHAGRVYVAWTRITAGKKRGDVSLLIVVSHSDDGGLTWTRPVVVPDVRDDPTTFASLAVDTAGNLFVAWTTVGRKLLVDRSVDGGDHFGADVLVGEAAGLPAETVCDQPGAFGIPAQAKRCITPTPTVLVDSRPGVAERVYVTYATPDDTGHAQDVVLRPFDSTLAPLDAVHRVHPADTKRDEFMPAAAVDEAGRVWACYYDTGGDRTRRTARYTCTASADGGATWATPRAVASVASDETRKPALAFQFGDYQGLAVAGGVAHPVWTDARDLKTRREEIYATTLTPADLQLP
jgi:hypothetical protein